MGAIEIRIIINEDGLIIATHPFSPPQLLQKANMGDAEAVLALSLLRAVQQWGNNINQSADPFSAPNG